MKKRTRVPNKPGRRASDPQLVFTMPIAVGIKTDTMESWAAGDEVVQLLAGASIPGGNGRYEIASKLNELAEIICATQGNPMERAVITVLLVKPRTFRDQ